MALALLPFMLFLLGCLRCPLWLVPLFDNTRGLPQRIEGQFRRGCGIAPAFWNLYFRERFNRGVSLSVKSKMMIRRPNKSVDEDAAMAQQDGIFMTISPGDRHNCLAIRLSR